MNQIQRFSLVIYHHPEVVCSSWEICWLVLHGLKQLKVLPSEEVKRCGRQGCITHIPLSAAGSIKSDIDGTAEILAHVCSLELDQKEACFWMMV